MSECKHKWGLIEHPYDYSILEICVYCHKRKKEVTE